MTSRKQHPAELRERAVAMVFELRAASGSSRGTLASVGQKLGVNPEALRNWADSTGVRKKLGELFRWCHESERLAGLPLRLRAMWARSPAECTDRPVPLGRYWRSNPLMFSFDPRLARTITWDQVIEMARHADFTLATGIPVDFCDPHASWQAVGPCAGAVPVAAGPPPA